MLQDRERIKLILIFILAFVLRLWGFPENVYFGFDQARDAYLAKGILEGDLKIVGPHSTFSPHFNHGVAYHYLIAPIYQFFGDPAILSLILRLYNAAGIFLAFLIGKNLFNSKVGLISAFIFAISFEQFEYGLFMGHPTMAVLTTMLFYLGFVLLIFQKRPLGLIFSAVGFGLSLQFHISLLFLAPLFLIFPLLFLKKLPRISLKIWGISVVGFILTTLTYILSEFKYGFKMLTGITSPEIQSFAEVYYPTEKLLNMDFIVNRFISDNFISSPIPFLSSIALILTFSLIFKNPKYFYQALFLLIWLLWGLLAYFINDSRIYYYSIGASIAMLSLGSFLIYQLLRKSLILGTAILFIILLNNLNNIRLESHKGPINSITSQDGMLLSSEKQVVDLTYREAAGEPFAINALTIPYSANTTWSYLYSWYGQKKYGYTPVWGGEHASGFPTELIVNTARSTLPEKRFLIEEPSQGLAKENIEKFFREEGYFAKKVKTTIVGKIKLHEQKSY